jgi:queuosine precursor transporter
MNEIFWLIMLVMNFLAIMTAYRIWGKTGLYIWIPISVMIANIQVTKTVVLFGMEATLGNIVYATSFLATDILSECYGKKAAVKAVGIGFFSLIVMTLLMNMAILFNPAPSDFVQESMSTIFGLMPRIALASLSAYLLSQLHDIWAYGLWHRLKPGIKWLWLRNNASTAVSQLIDTLLFTLLAFWGVFPWSILWQIMLTTYVLKWIVAMLDTPFIYLARNWHESKKIPDTL